MDVEKSSCGIDQETLDRFLEGIQEIWQCIGVALNEALEQLGSFWDSLKASWDWYRRVLSCPSVPKRLLHLAFHSRKARVRKKNLKRIQKVVEDYYGY